MGEEEYMGAHLRATYLAGRRQQALAEAAAVRSEQPIARWDVGLVYGELLLRSGQREHGKRELEQVLGEARAAGHLRVQHAATALLEGKLDQGYR